MRGETVPEMGREGHLHRAVFNRQAELRDLFPGSRITIQIDDHYPRATVAVKKCGKMVREEFFESAASIADLQLDDECFRALGRTKSIAIHLPSMSYDGTFVVELVTNLQVKAHEKNIKGRLVGDGFLYDFYGNEDHVA